MSPRTWRPSPLEKKCLAHLDAPEAWRILRAERPDEAEVQSWRPFRPIFVFNFVLFAVLLGALFTLLEVASGVAPSDIREDLPVGGAVVLALAASLGFYSAYLYRHSWNGRARYLSRAAEPND